MCHNVYARENDTPHTDTRRQPITGRKEDGMTNIELQELLAQYPDDMEVRVTELGFSGDDSDSIADVAGNYVKFNNRIILIETNRY